MMDRPSFLRECVRSCISDDYENFDKITEDVRRWAGCRKIEPSIYELIEAIESLITEGDAKAYILSARPAKSEQVTYIRDNLNDLWFYVTPQGKSKAQSILELTGED